MNSYTAVISYLFSKLFVPGAERLDFTRDDLDAAISALSLSIKNVSDIRYTFDSRLDMPEEISQHGNWAIIGRGKSKYCFVKIDHKNIIRVPEDIACSTFTIIDAPDCLPDQVAEIIGTDEQAVLTKLNYSGALTTALNMVEVHKIQGHLRTYLSLGQIEIDDLYVGLDAQGDKYIIPISAKAGNDNLSFTQVYNLCKLCEEKYPTYKPCPVGLYTHNSSLIYILRFSAAHYLKNITIDSSACVSLRKTSSDLPIDWKVFLKHELEKPYINQLQKFLNDEKRSHQICPKTQDTFAAFKRTSVSQVSVVILGQDPYPNPDNATGLSFSTKSTEIPASLRNIKKELLLDVNQEFDGADLSHWAEQGVLLLNSTLTCRAGYPGSHVGQGWEEFTNSALSRLSCSKQNIVFILWGRTAQKAAALLDATRHRIIVSAHPSPLSATSGFFGSKPFSKANEYLVSVGKQPIQWGRMRGD